MQSGSSYISQEDKRLHFGLGKAAQVDVARGPLAGRDDDDVADVKANQILEIRQ